MRTILTAASVLLLSAAAFGCGSNADGTPGEPGVGEPAAARAESPLEDDIKCDGTEVTVKNYLSWCGVTVGSGTKSRAAEQMVCAPTGTLDLAAVAEPGFELGKRPWHRTTTQAKDGTATLSIVSGDKKACVWVCCEGTGGSPPCPTTNQCP